MDPVIVQSLQHFGALGILALMVWKSPGILSGISELIQKVIGTVRETQTEALEVFKTEQQSLIDMVDRRFQTIETTLVKLVEIQTTLVTGISSLGVRVEHLERDKPK